VRSALEWARVRALAGDGVSEREIARRLGINRRMVARVARGEEPPRSRPAPAGSKLDRPALLGRADGVLQPRADDRGVLEGHMRAFEWLGGVPRVYDNLRAVVARREGDQVSWNPRFVHLRGHYGFHATACTPASPREKGSVEVGVRSLQSGFWPARRLSPWASSISATPTGATASPTGACTRAGAYRSPSALPRSARRCGRCRRRASTRPGSARRWCRSTGTYAMAAASTGRRRALIAFAVLVTQRRERTRPRACGGSGSARTRPHPRR
jgi:hypothetical protein